MSLSRLLLLFAASAFPASLAAAPSVALHRSPRTIKVVHVIVPLCDNEHQGIVPVSKALGDGKDREKNLYWGAGYGFRTFFRTSKAWTELTVAKPATKSILERVAFVHGDTYVVADAYDGERMDHALRDFMAFSAGARADDVDVTRKDGTKVHLEAGGRSDLLAFVGHDGLMDGIVPPVPNAIGDRPYGAIVVACFSRSWFSPLMKQAKVPLWVGTTNLLAAEAYSVEAAIRAYAEGAAPAAMRAAAGKAYAKYQKISEGSGLGAFSTDG
jgi:hypothetical protein